MASRPLDIQSTDIDVSRIPLDAIYTMRSIFPHEEDETIARFLLARNGNIEKAKTLLEEDIAWRATNWPVLKSSCISEINKGKLYLHGVDLEGHPLLVWRVRFNLPSERDIDEMGRMSMWWLYSAIRAMPRDKSKITLLMDRSGFKSENSDFEFVKHLTPIFQNHFPERLHRVIVYPSGLVFYGIWNVVKWFLDPVTQAKVQPVLALSGVQQYIDNSFIPADMGGDCHYSFNPDDYQDPYDDEILRSVSASTTPAIDA